MDCVAVSAKVIRLKAISLICPVNPNFKASDGWVRKFMKKRGHVTVVCVHVTACYLHAIMAAAFEHVIESAIRGFHVYNTI